MLKISFLFLLLVACQPKRFELLSPSRTGIDFANTITESDSFNVLTFEYIYNGGGVGVADFNKDGLMDIFLSGNQVPCRLYLNRGDFHFEDITAAAQIHTPYWSTGISIADLNLDGLPDIYLCTAHPDRNKSAPNQLFISQGLNAQGIPQFQELAQQSGLADTAYATQAAFLDYDHDGDLDMYLLNNALESFDRSLPIGQRMDGSGKSTDKLYRNEGLSVQGLPLFCDVSDEAGIRAEGWGLGVGVGDLNADGWPDIYAANDFQSNDHLWINSGKGTFNNEIAHSLRHQSHNSMGMDIGDLNNDGLPDIVNLDMMPEDNLRQKTMFGRPAYDRFALSLRQGYQPQYVRNSLQLHRGLDARGLPVYSEIGYLAAISATDWSWSALMADIDNDGWRDIFITNGYARDVTNLDFAAYKAQSRVFSANAQGESVQQRLGRMEALLGVKKPNILFRNRHDLTFENLSEAWGLAQPSFSNGAAYADLDNDGDLDLLVNNLNAPAFVYRNNTNKASTEATQAAFLRIKLKGGSKNPDGYGALVRLYSAGKMQQAEHYACRGYLSSQEPILHFGLGSLTRIDSLILTWPAGRREVRRSLAANQTLTFSEAEAPLYPAKPPLREPTLFKEASHTHGLLFRHEEDDFPDFKVQALLPHKHSQEGPALAVGDLNGDGLDDLFVGGAAGKAATVFYQQKGDLFTASPFLGKAQEDAGVLLFDADGDGDNDVYCLSGSSEFGKQADKYPHRLYFNEGQGKWRLELLPFQGNGSCLTACDFDRDGDLDLFAGGRVQPAAYPLAPKGFLLLNDGKGHFSDATDRLAPGLSHIGMVSAALWSDYDQDGWTDLIAVGEFMPLSFFHNQHGYLQVINSPLPPSAGWWNSLAGGDFDNDGDMDYVAGNLGLNSFYQASPTQPLCVYAADYNQDGLMDPLLCHYLQGKEYPLPYRDALTDQAISFKKKLTSYDAYGRMTINELLTPDQRQGALVKRATQMRSMFIRNLGQGHFDWQPLPIEAQFAPLNGLQVSDINLDGYLDVLMVGNNYGTDVLTGRLDASLGEVLLGDGQGGLHVLPHDRSGWLMRGDAKALVMLRMASGRPLFLVSQNQDSLKVFENPGMEAKIGKRWQAKPLDSHVEVLGPGGRKQKIEILYGAGYLSQASRTLWLPPSVKTLIVTDSQGRRRKEWLR